MPMMLWLLPRIGLPVTAEKVPADAHDAVPFAQDRLERFQLMLMMPYLFAR